MGKLTYWGILMPPLPFGDICVNEGVNLSPITGKTERVIPIPLRGP